MNSKKRERLLEVAEKLFYEHGFHAIGIKRIVNEANVALMTIYNHFQSKEELIIEILRRREKRYFSYLKSTLSKENVDLSLAEGHLNWIRSGGNNGCLFLRAKEEFSAAESDIVVFTNEHKKRTIALFQEVGLTSNEALQLMLLLEGATALAEIVAIEDVTTELKTIIEKKIS